MIVSMMVPARRLTVLISALVALSTCASALPLTLRDGPGPARHISIRGNEVITYGVGPYRHMPADVAVQGLAQDAVTLAVAVPILVIALIGARRGSRVAHLVLVGTVLYLFVQYFMYLGMGSYNELFLLWVASVLASSQCLVRLLLATPVSDFTVHVGSRRRRFIGGFLLVNGALIALLWLQTIVPPLLDGTLYPAGLAHFTTLIVQGFDLALFLPLSFVAGFRYLARRSAGDLLGPVYAVFLSLQMLALLAKIVWMAAVGVSAGPALVVIPALLVGAVTAAALALLPHRNTRLA